MLSQTVYRGRNNSIVLQLLQDDAPLDPPTTIDEVELTADGVTVDPDGDHIVYEDGALTMQLGLVEEILALEDGNHLIEVTGFGPAAEEGIAFGTFQIYLTPFGESVGT